MFYVTPVRGVIHIGEYDEHNRFDVQLTVPTDELYVRTNRAGQMYLVVNGVAHSMLHWNYRQLISTLDAIIDVSYDDVITIDSDNIELTVVKAAEKRKAFIDREELEDALEVINEKRCEFEYGEQFAQEYAEHFGTMTPEEEYQNKLAWEAARIRDLLS
tara:strand:+ start:324 stop:800 length:477 start_codon:yes stop_codon:yes gene_type:complete